MAVYRCSRGDYLAIESVDKRLARTLTSKITSRLCELNCAEVKTASATNNGRPAILIEVCGRLSVAPRRLCQLLHL